MTERLPTKKYIGVFSLGSVTMMPIMLKFPRRTISEIEERGHCRVLDRP